MLYPCLATILYADYGLYAIELLFVAGLIVAVFAPGYRTVGLLTAISCVVGEVSYYLASLAYMRLGVTAATHQMFAVAPWIIYIVSASCFLVARSRKNRFRKWVSAVAVSSPFIFYLIFSDFSMFLHYDSRPIPEFRGSLPEGTVGYVVIGLDGEGLAEAHVVWIGAQGNEYISSQRLEAVTSSGTIPRDVHYASKIYYQVAISESDIGGELKVDIRVNSASETNHSEVGFDISGYTNVEIVGLVGPAKANDEFFVPGASSKAQIILSFGGELILPTPSKRGVVPEAGYFTPFSRVNAIDMGVYSDHMARVVYHVNSRVAFIESHGGRIYVLDVDERVLYHLSDMKKTCVAVIEAGVR